MARIPDEELERLKREIPVADLARARAVELAPHGQNLIGLCPFHDDHEPSLVITPAKNLWHCLGACQAGGSVIDFVMKAEGVSFRHAVELLRTESSSLAAAPSTEPVKRSTVRKLPAPVDFDADDRALLNQVVGYYHQTLKECPEALAYLESRGLGSAEMIDRFQIGFANRTLGYRLPQRNRVAGAELRGRLQRLGIIRDSGHEHFAGSIVIPVIDEDGTVREIYGRKITRGLRAGTALHLYLPAGTAFPVARSTFPDSDNGQLATGNVSRGRGVWNIEALKAAKGVILCEALLDALTFWAAGFRNVTASYGVEGFTDEHLDAFRRYSTERVLIAYDRDQAGDAAAVKLASKLRTHGIACSRIEFPHGMDANAYAMKVTPAAKSLAVLVRSARSIGEALAPIPSLPESNVVEVVNHPPAQSEIPSLAAKAEPGVTVPSEASFEQSRGSEGPPAERTAEGKSDEVVIRLGERKYRVRGLSKNTSYDTLRVNLLAANAESFHVDSLDLYQARQRQGFLKQAALELAVDEKIIKKDLAKVLLALEERQDEVMRGLLEPKAPVVTLTDSEQAEALELLRDPHLLERILADFEKCGVVGEETNKLVGYLAAVSRKLEEPLAVIIQSSSAAGKSSLMEAILAFVPAEERVKYSAMTGQSLFYMGETDLKQKILAIVEEQGAERAAYALKLLQSEGELTIASTGKDPQSGKLTTHQYRVEGPVMIFLTTTAVEIDEELLNRAIVLTVDEEREQTRAIHRLQRERQTLEGLLARETREKILTLHRNAQRLLRPLLVANPYARELTFSDAQTRTRRDHLKYLTLIRSIALLHQYQRELKTVTHDGKRIEYIEVSPEDIQTANRLAHQVLGRSLDELAPQTRRLLGLLHQMVADACRRLSIDRSEYRFSRRDVREHTGWGNTQLKLHLRRLEEMEYVVVHGGQRGQSFVYELLYDGEGEDGRRFLLGLIDSPHHYDEKHVLNSAEGKSGVSGNWSGSESEKSAPGRPQVGAKSGGGRSAPTSRKPLSGNGSFDSEPDVAENAHRDQSESAPSYRSAVLARGR